MSSNHQPAIIETTGLRRVFGETVAVAGLDLAIAPGEIFGLLGPDGAGKTTTLRLLASILEPTAGHATVAGFDVRRDKAAIKRRIGYMAQAFSLYRDLTVIENLNFFADVFGVRGKQRRARVDRLLAFARLTEFKGRRAEQLSGGMQKKLGLACTLIHEPEILLLDEPTTGVDPVSRREFWDILADLHLQGATIVISTPYMDEAERCARIGLMHAGKLIEHGTPAEIKRSVPGQLIEVRPAQRLAARKLLAETPGVHEVQSYGETLHVFVDNARDGQKIIGRALKQAGIEYSGMRPIEPRVEEAFISLIRRQSEQEQAP